MQYTQKFDDKNAELEKLIVSDEELLEAEKNLNDDVKQALEFALDRIYKFHARQKPKHDYFEDDTGTYLGYRWTPVDAAGVYIPGGAASYPSSVLMNIAPAKVAGVERIVAVVPAPNGKVDPSVLYALKIAGANEIYKVGGAQAIAALAYGTDMIKAVDKITGPGNAFVAEAKRQVYGQVGIDLTTEEAKLASKEIGLSILANIKHEIGDLSRITSWVRVFGMVNSAPGYDEQHIVINGFSELVLEVFGPDVGRHSRSAIGVAGLPMNLAIEIEGEVLIK